MDAEETRAYMKAYYQKNREKQIAARRLKHLNCSAEQYATALQQQNGLCAVCDRPERIQVRGKPRALAADHDHESGLFRGLLCTACNVALGQLQDDPLRVKSLLAYLERN